MSIASSTASPVRELMSAALRRRRVRIWGPVVLLIVAGLSALALIPGGDVLPSFLLHHGATTLLFVFLAALICEYIDSSLGMGYGTALTPILLMAGFEPHAIVPCILLSECLTGALAGLLHHRDGNMDLLRDRHTRWTAIFLAALSLFGAIFAVNIAQVISKETLTGAIGTVITAMGLIILITVRHQFRYRVSHLMAVGAVAAFNKGLTGGGYGPLVTAGQVVSGVSTRAAVGITSVCESLTCLVGLLTYLAVQRQIDWSLAVPLAGGALLSVPFATLTVRRMPERWVRGAVGLATLALGLLTLYKLVVN